jgi:putative membrane protein
MMFWTDHALSGWGWLAMSVSMILFWGLLITLAVLLVRAVGQPTELPDRHPRLTPQQVLAERFARGEIDDDEYHRRLATLQLSDTVGPQP